MVEQPYSAAATPGVAQEHRTSVAIERGWCVIVWNVPVNLMSYVVHVFRQVLGFDKAKARRHMLEVHEQGQSCVARENREKAELYCQLLQQHGLRATLQREA